MPAAIALEMSVRSHLFKLRSAALPGLMVAAAAVLSGCTSDALNPRQTLTQGYVADEQALELVPVGSSREQVLLALGTPSTTATFDNEVFYYISQTRVRQAAFMNPKLVDQRIMAVYFGDDGRVENIANYGLQDGKVFDFVSRTTPTGGKDQGFIGQLLSGVGSGAGAASSAGRVFGG
jgi:outer membrane protein assembly factor BamE (lipoprotein component of BamABCDE complex)